MKRALDNRHFELSTAFYRELGFVRVGVGCRQAPWAVDSVLFLSKSEQVSKFVSDPNSDFFLFLTFLEGLHAYI